IGAYRNTKVRKILPNGYVTTYAGSDTYGTTNGPLATATFTETFSTIFDQYGNMYVSDHGNWMIRKISAAGYVSTLAGNGTVGDADGTGTGAVLHNNNFINVDSSGNVYVSLGMPHYKIRKITPSGVSTVFAGPASGAEGNGSTDGYRTDARFSWPGQMIFDNAGNMYVADASNGIRKISPSGMVSTYYKDAGFYTYCITFGKDGYIYTSDQYANKIYKLVPDTSGGLDINNGDKYTNSTAVKLNLAAIDDYSGVNSYYAAESPAPPDSSATWKSVTLSAGGTAEVNFTLSTVTKPVTVYVWFRDTAGNVSSFSSKVINPRSMKAVESYGNSSTFNKPFLIAKDSSENLIVADKPSAGTTPVFKLSSAASPKYSAGNRVIAPGTFIDRLSETVAGLVVFKDGHFGLIETAKKRFAIFDVAGAFINGCAKSIDLTFNYHGLNTLADSRAAVYDKYSGGLNPYAEARVTFNQNPGAPLDLHFAPAGLEVFKDAAFTIQAGTISPSDTLYIRLKGAGGDVSNINSIIARAKSREDARGISIQLTETNNSTDIFTATLRLGNYSDVGAGILGAGYGDQICVSVYSKNGILSKTFKTKPKPPSGPFFTADLGGGVFIEMVRIKAGTFVMGQAGVATPTHEVTLTRDYYMSKYEITQAQWLKVMGPPASVNCPISPARGYYINGKGADYPVHSITWEDICNSGGFLDKLNALAPDGINIFRLPTEAEWEYACRAGTATTFYWGEDDSESAAKQYCWYSLNANASFWTTPHAPDSGNQPVGQKIPNNWGLYDMLGNAGEFCSDWYASYTADAATDPTGPASGTQRVIRRGSWNLDIGSSKSSSRSPVSPTHQAVIYGLRLVFTAEQ
ncbi:MAG TPA: SUMF1/EgtB/PvdO family nonheme iron enzyme, partial [Candidatus Wallbacteria bacterium]|nr:SUMF1/EgtB/PvdO family nonheme iron enzyme [Candidatus Wallbacteria bacterium]